MNRITRKPVDVALNEEVRREADRHEPIVTRDGYTVLDPAAWHGLMDTLRILTDPANAEDLRAAVREADEVRLEEIELLRECFDRAMEGEPDAG
jgi:PHD/YefM family antitoxin component YafN of YafNO toxin-antitoxin module